MKKLLSFMFVVGLSYSTWQVYNPITKTLVVYTGDNDKSQVYYQGTPNGYTPAAEALRSVWNAPYPMPTASARVAATTTEPAL